MEYSVILFYSNNFAIWTSKLMERNHFECKVIPVPRSLSSDCGYCVRIKTDDLDQIMPLIEEQGIEFDRVDKYTP